MSLEYPCVHFENGICKKQSEPGDVGYCVNGPCPYEEPSVGDRVRCMTDEELAHFIGHIESDKGFKFCTSKPECSECLEKCQEIPEEWCMACLVAALKKPAEKDKK